MKRKEKRDLYESPKCEVQVLPSALHLLASVSTYIFATFEEIDLDEEEEYDVEH